MRQVIAWTEPQQHIDIAETKVRIKSRGLAPCCAKATARLTATLVLPTPPLPLAMAITLIGFLARIRRSPSA